MYIPRQYEWKNQQDIKSFINEHPFAIVINQVDGKPWATHTPIISTEKEDVLFGHISKANPQWRTLQDQEIMVIFNGPHSYISSSWYDHESVPTWNYLAVHIYGKIKIVEGENLKNHMSNFMAHFESSQPKGQKMEDLSPSYIEREIKGIVGFEIQVKEVQAVEKMSQGKNEKNKKVIAEELDKNNHPNDSLTAKHIKGKSLYYLYKKSCYNAFRSQCRPN